MNLVARILKIDKINLMIESYHFGYLKINGKTYHFDVEVRWNGKVLKWERKESHKAEIEDIKRAVSQKPDTIVIGRGAFGVLKVSNECQNFIREKGINLIIDKTEEAVKTFNIILQESEEETGRQEKVIGLFHLTC